MNLYDTARVRHPRDGFEYRLGTVIDIHAAPYSTYAERYRLRFPTGDERTYPATEVTACTRADDQAALVADFTDACEALRNACRTAHDYDQELSTDIIGLLLALYTTARTRLNLELNPASSTTPAPSDNRDGERP